MLVFDQNIPILLLVFNRPELTAQVFDRIKFVEPKKLYIAADGPRTEEEDLKCKEVRAIVKNITWDCEINTLFRNENLGCGKAVSGGIIWFFEQEEYGIVLEDDCLPEPNFFSFCSTMLKYFKNDERIGHISGSNFQDDQLRGDGDYYFSALTHVWGWASWSRVWKDYDYDISTFPNLDKTLKAFPAHAHYASNWNTIFYNVHNGKINTWDYQYAYHNLIKGYKAIMPNVNLISNIGIGEDATHTQGEHPLINDRTGKIESIRHPTFLIQDVDADCYTQEKEFGAFKTKEKGFLSKTWKNLKNKINEK